MTKTTQQQHDLRTCVQSANAYAGTPLAPGVGALLAFLLQAWLSAHRTLCLRSCQHHAKLVECSLSAVTVMLYVFLTDCRCSGIVATRKNSVAALIVCHLHGMSCCECTFSILAFIFLSCSGNYQGRPVSSCAVRSAVCIYRLKNQTSSCAAAQLSSSMPATALKMLDGSKAAT